jgi:hypothetical protein
MPAIFISHSSRDQQVADNIKSALARLGFERIFLAFDKDTGIGAGEDWEKRLYARNSLPWPKAALCRRASWSFAAASPPLSAIPRRPSRYCTRHLTCTARSEPPATLSAWRRRSGRKREISG